MAVTKARQVEITSCRHRPFTSLFMYVKQTTLPRIQLREKPARQKEEDDNDTRKMSDSITFTIHIYNAKVQIQIKKIKKEKKWGAI